jgi:hypothetical protein
VFPDNVGVKQDENFFSWQENRTGQKFNKNRSARIKTGQNRLSLLLKFAICLYPSPPQKIYVHF